MRNGTTARGVTAGRRAGISTLDLKPLQSQSRITNAVNQMKADGYPVQRKASLAHQEEESSEDENKPANFTARWTKKNKMAKLIDLFEEKRRLHLGAVTAEAAARQYRAVVVQRLNGDEVVFTRELIAELHRRKAVWMRVAARDRAGAKHEIEKYKEGL